MEGIERLKNMLGEGFQKPLLKIFMYLKTREDMDEKYLNPEKSLNQMYDYIKSEANKQAVNGVAIIDDAVVYSLAVHYFNETNEALGLNKKVEKVKKVENKENSSEEKETVKSETLTENEDKEQISLFAEEFGGVT